MGPESDFELLIDAECCLARVRECMLSIWRGPAATALVDAHSSLARKLIRQYGQTAMLIVIEPDTPPPHAEPRALIERFYVDLGSELRCVAQVVEGSGFGASAARAVMSTINLVAQRAGSGVNALRTLSGGTAQPPSSPRKVFVTVEQAAPWVAQHLARKRPHDLTASEILASVAEARLKSKWKLGEAPRPRSMPAPDSWN